MTRPTTTGPSSAILPIRPILSLLGVFLSIARRRSLASRRSPKRRSRSPSPSPSLLLPARQPIHRILPMQVASILILAILHVDQPLCASRRIPIPLPPSPPLLPIAIAPSPVLVPLRRRRRTPVRQAPIARHGRLTRIRVGRGSLAPVSRHAPFDGGGRHGRGGGDGLVLDGGVDGRKRRMMSLRVRGTQLGSLRRRRRGLPDGSVAREFGGGLAGARWVWFFHRHRWLVGGLGCGW